MARERSFAPTLNETIEFANFSLRRNNGVATLAIAASPSPAVNSLRRWTATISVCQNALNCKSIALKPIPASVESALGPKKLARI